MDPPNQYLSRAESVLSQPSTQAQNLQKKSRIIKLFTAMTFLLKVLQAISQKKKLSLILKKKISVVIFSLTKNSLPGHRVKGSLTSNLSVITVVFLFD